MTASFIIATSTTTVKALVYTAFDVRTPYSHKEIANLVRLILPTANTSDKSVASMKVDWKNQYGTNTSGAERPRGQVKALVYAMFEQGDMTAKAIAAAVLEQLPNAQTTDKSVASMKVDWKRAGGKVTGHYMVEATADHFGLISGDLRLQLD